MLIGIILGIICRALLREKDQGSQDIRISTLAGLAFKGPDAWLSMFGSPIVYGSILRSGADLPVGAFAFFALQTGFSSYVAIRALMDTTPAPSGR